MTARSAAFWIAGAAWAALSCGGVVTATHGDPDRSDSGGSGAVGGTSATGGTSGGGRGGFVGTGGGKVLSGGAAGSCPGTREECNSLDDDCDGLVDEPESSPGAGDGIDFTSPDQCGTCDTFCGARLSHANGAKCIPPGSPKLYGVTPGTCDYDTCAVASVDLDQDRSNGCEYDCPSAPLHLTADVGGLGCGIDDDCNGKIDDLDLCSSENCGACGTSCLGRPHLPGSCSSTPAPSCDAMSAHCVYAACEAGWEDRDQNDENGCEARVGSPQQSGPEICDGWDNDGDGSVDESGPAPEGVDGTADPNNGGNRVGKPCGSSVGNCKLGIFECVGGAVTCVGSTSPAPEVCDGLDNDCDGDIDETPETNCGAGFCALSFTYARCVDFCGGGEQPCPTGMACVIDLRVSTNPNDVRTAAGCVFRDDPR